MIAVPPMVSASHSPWQLSFCSILGGGPGNNTQDPQEESREGSVKSPKHDTVDAPNLCRTYSFLPVDPHSAPYLILVIILWRMWGKADELLIIDVVVEGLGGYLPGDTWVITRCLSPDLPLQLGRTEGPRDPRPRNGYLLCFTSPFDI